jgi:hypothetical protein
MDALNAMSKIYGIKKIAHKSTNYLDIPHLRIKYW